MDNPKIQEWLEFEKKCGITQENFNKKFSFVQLKNEIQQEIEQENTDPVAIYENYERRDITNIYLPFDHKMGSFKDGLSVENELKLRSLGIQLIINASVFLKLSVLTCHTAAMLFHRFYTRVSFYKRDFRDIAMGSLFLATKTEENIRKTRDIAMVFDQVFKISQGLPRPVTPLIPKSEKYNRYMEIIADTEREILCELGFEIFNISENVSPQKYLYNYLFLFKPANKTQQDKIKNYQKLIARAFGYLNDSIRTPLCVHMPPNIIACSCIYLALRDVNYSQPSNCWWVLFGAGIEMIEECAGMILQLYTIDTGLCMNDAYVIMKDLIKAKGSKKTFTLEYLELQQQNFISQGRRDNNNSDLSKNKEQQVGERKDFITNKNRSRKQMSPSRSKSPKKQKKHKKHKRRDSVDSQDDRRRKDKKKKHKHSQSPKKKKYRRDSRSRSRSKDRRQKENSRDRSISQQYSKRDKKRDETDSLQLNSNAPSTQKMEIEDNDSVLKNRNDKYREKQLSPSRRSISRSKSKQQNSQEREKNRDKRSMKDYKDKYSSRDNSNLYDKQDSKYNKYEKDSYREKDRSDRDLKEKDRSDRDLKEKDREYRDVREKDRSYKDRNDRDYRDRDRDREKYDREFRDRDYRDKERDRDRDRTRDKYDRERQSDKYRDRDNNRGSREKDSNNEERDKYKSKKTSRFSDKNPNDNEENNREKDKDLLNQGLSDLEDEKDEGFDKQLTNKSSNNNNISKKDKDKTLDNLRNLLRSKNGSTQQSSDKLQLDKSKSSSQQQDRDKSKIKPQIDRIKSILPSSRTSISERIREKPSLDKNDDYKSSNGNNNSNGDGKRKQSEDDTSLEELMALKKKRENAKKNKQMGNSGNRH